MTDIVAAPAAGSFTQAVEDAVKEAEKLTPDIERFLAFRKKNIGSMNYSAVVSRKNPADRLCRLSCEVADPFLPHKAVAEFSDDSVRDIITYLGRDHSDAKLLNMALVELRTAKPNIDFIVQTPA